MQLSSLQQQVAAFVATHALEIPVELRLLDLVSEVGELAKEPLAATKYGRTPFAPGEAWAGELGDTLFSLICLANSTDVDLEAALHATLAKYATRLAASGSAGSTGNSP